MKKVFAVEKSAVQVAGFFGLDKKPHAVLGKHAPEAFCGTFGGKLELLSNNQDHHYDSTYPYKPIVCNTREVCGIDSPFVLQLLRSHLPSSLLGSPLIKQVYHVMHTGLQRHADEFISLALHDKCHVLGFHAGPPPKEGAQWSRKNGNGIAMVGLGKNCL